jgi:catabolite regulation protein CreA
MGVIVDMDSRMRMLDRKNNAISYRTVLNHSYQTKGGSIKTAKLVTYFVFFLTPLSHPNPITK